MEHHRIDVKNANDEGVIAIPNLSQEQAEFIYDVLFFKKGLPEGTYQIIMSNGLNEVKRRTKEFRHSSK